MWMEILQLCKLSTNRINHVATAQPAHPAWAGAPQPESQQNGTIDQAPLIR